MYNILIKRIIASTHTHKAFPLDGGLKAVPGAAALKVRPVVATVFAEALDL